MIFSSRRPVTQRGRATGGLGYGGGWLIGGGSLGRLEKAVVGSRVACPRQLTCAMCSSAVLPEPEP